MYDILYVVNILIVKSVLVMIVYVEGFLYLKEGVFMLF